MLKIIPPGAQDFGDSAAQIIKIASGRLNGMDRQELIKRAGAWTTHQLDGMEFANGEVPIHLIAMGATEAYGPNRNGDGFREETCRNHHDTFVKHARWYRNHANKDPKRSYGIIKASAYNEAMRRIELIVALNGNAEAARRNGGMVADEELEKLARDQEIPVSMACLVPFDVCSHCGNKAKSRAEYCDSPEHGGHCKAGGLKHNMGKTLGDGTTLHADNPGPGLKWIDMSKVFRPADRTAYVTGSLKEASQQMCGAELAESLGLTIPFSALAEPGMSGDLLTQLKLACVIANEEATTPPSPWSLAFSSLVQPGLRRPEIRRYKLAEALRALADEQILLPLPQFLALTTTLPEKSASDIAATVSLLVPGSFKRLTQTDVSEKLQQNPYNPAPGASGALRKWAASLAPDFAVTEPWLSRRLRLATLRGATPPAALDLTDRTKLAAALPTAVSLAEQYALYKLATLAEIFRSPYFQLDTDLRRATELALAIGN